MQKEFNCPFGYFTSFIFIVTVHIGHTVMIHVPVIKKADCDFILSHVKYSV